MRQSTSRICIFCGMRGDEYGVIYGDPTEKDRAMGHDPKANRDMDAHQRSCAKNPHRSMSVFARIQKWIAG